MNKFLTQAVMSDWLTLACKQFVKMLIKLQEVLGQEEKCLCGKSTIIRME